MSVLSNAKFAARCSNIAVLAAGWSRDCLMLDEDLDKPIGENDAGRFIRDMRQILDYLERSTNESDSPEIVEGCDMTRFAPLERPSVGHSFPSRPDDLDEITRLRANLFAILHGDETGQGVQYREAIDAAAKAIGYPRV